MGINTTTPSPAAVLDVSSSADGTNFGGFMLPRVIVAQRDAIPVTVDDAGLIVYVLNGSNSQLQIWDGTNWRPLFPQTIQYSAVISAWEMDGLSNYGPSPYNASVSSESVTVEGLTRASGLTTAGTAAANAWGANNWYMGAPLESKEEAIANNRFITFTITPNFGVNLSITTIEPYNIRRIEAGPTTGIWQYSLNGIDFFDIGSEIIWGTTYTAIGNPHAAIDLSGISDLQNLTSSTTVTFRIVNWGASSGPNHTWYFNRQNAGPDLIIRGNIN